MPARAGRYGLAAGVLMDDPGQALPLSVDTAGGDRVYSGRSGFRRHRVIEARQSMEVVALQKKPYEKPQIVYTQKIEARAVVCAKQVGDDACEGSNVNS
jgi:hypothetical protein